MIYPPEYADLSQPRLQAWIPPRQVTLSSPTWVGRAITLPDPPYVAYHLYRWNENSFLPSNSRATYTTGTTAHAPIVLTVEGRTATDQTDYRSLEAPQLSDYELTRRVDYYVDGHVLRTNIDFERLGVPASSVVITYWASATALQVRIGLHGVGSHIPTIDAFTLLVTPHLHPVYQNRTDPL